MIEHISPPPSFVNQELFSESILACPNGTGIEGIATVINPDGSYSLQVNLCPGFGFKLDQFRNDVARSIGLEPAEGLEGVEKLWNNQPAITIDNGTVALTTDFTIPIETTSEGQQCHLNIPLSSGVVADVIIPTEGLSKLIESATYSMGATVIEFGSGTIAGEYAEEGSADSNFMIVIISGSVIGLLALAKFTFSQRDTDHPASSGSVGLGESKTASRGGTQDDLYYDGYFMGEYVKNLDKKTDEERIAEELKSKSDSMTIEQKYAMYDEADRNRSEKSALARPHDSLAIEAARKQSNDQGRDGYVSISKEEQDLVHKLTRGNDDLNRHM